MSEEEKPNPFSRITTLVADPAVLDQAFWAFNPSRPLIADPRLRGAMVLADVSALERAVRAIAEIKYLPEDAEQALVDVLADISLLDAAHCRLGRKERETVLGSFYPSYLIASLSSSGSFEIPKLQEIDSTGVPKSSAVRSRIRNRAARVALFVDSKLQEVTKPSRFTRRVTGT